MRRALSGFPDSLPTRLEDWTPPPAPLRNMKSPRQRGRLRIINGSTHPRRGSRPHPPLVLLPEAPSIWLLIHRGSSGLPNSLEIRSGGLTRLQSHLRSMPSPLQTVVLQIL